MAGHLTIPNWGIFVLGLIAYQILKLLYLALEQHLTERREKNLLKMVQVVFPDREKITFVTIDANDKRAMAKLEREIRSHYDVTDDDYVDSDLPRPVTPSPHE